MTRHHSIDYVELAAPDLATSQRFFSEAFGWEFNAYGSQYAGIRRTDGDGEAGGLDAAAVPGVGSPLVILYSEDLELTLAAVLKAGGVPQEPYEFPGGRRFHFTDPAGNELAVWTSA